MTPTSDKKWAREALGALLARITRNMANERLLAALWAVAEERARARARRKS